MSEIRSVYPLLNVHTRKMSTILIDQYRFPSGGGGGLISFIASGSGGSADSNSIISSSFNSTGGNFIVGICAYYDFGVTPAVSDNKGNTANYLTRTIYANGFVKVFIFYCPAATCGSGHTVTLTGTGTFPSVVAAAFSNVKTASPYDVENGASASAATSVQPGSVTPSNNNQLVVAVLNGNLLNETISIDSSFSTPITVNSDGSNHVCASLSYKIQTTAGAINPTFSWTTSQGVVAAIATFKNT